METLPTSQSLPVRASVPAATATYPPHNRNPPASLTSCSTQYRQHCQTGAPSAASGTQQQQQQQQQPKTSLPGSMPSKENYAQLQRHHLQLQQHRDQQAASLGAMAHQNHMSGYNARSAYSNALALGPAPYPGMFGVAPDQLRQSKDSNGTFPNPYHQMTGVGPQPQLVMMPNSGGRSQMGMEMMSPQGRQQQQHFQEPVHSEFVIQSMVDQQRQQMMMRPQTSSSRVAGPVDKKRSSQKSEEKKKPYHYVETTESCRICREPATKHMHYGAITCFSCKAFFRRAIQNDVSHDFICRGDNNCEIGVQSRKHCQKCRFKRCLAVGMKPGWVLSKVERQKRFTRRGSDKESPNAGVGSSGHEEPQQHEQKSSGEPSSPPNLMIQRAAARMQVGQYKQQMSLESFESSGSNSGTATSPEEEPPVVKQEQSSPPTSPVTSSQAAPTSSASQIFNNGGYSSSPPPSSDDDGGRNSANNFSDSIVSSSSNAGTNNLEAAGDNELAFFRKRSRTYKPRFRALESMSVELHIERYEKGVISNMSTIFDYNYNSVPMGESLLKEMMMCSMFGIQMSTSAAMNAYRLIVKRVMKVANGFSQFTGLPTHIQSALLRNNVDMLVCLQGALFFESSKKGLDQVCMSMGGDDHLFGKEMIEKSKSKLKDPSDLGRIDYDKFNTIQDLENDQLESRFAGLLARIGGVIIGDEKLTKLLAFIVMFATDGSNLSREDRKQVETAQVQLITVMQRYVNIEYSREEALMLFGNLINCLADLRELSYINTQRTFKQSAEVEFQQMSQAPPPAPAAVLSSDAD